MNETKTMNRPKAETAVEPPLILVVEDDPDMRFVYREWLRDRYGLICLENGEEFFETVFDFKPALIILDVELPGPDGFALCRRLRMFQKTRGIPVLFITGKRSDEDFVENLNAGGDAFLTKPVRERELLRYVEALVQRA